MASLSKKVLSLWKQILISLVPSESECAWDDYRRARLLREQLISENS